MNMLPSIEHHYRYLRTCTTRSWSSRWLRWPVGFCQLQVFNLWKGIVELCCRFAQVRWRLIGRVFKAGWNRLFTAHFQWYAKRILRGALIEVIRWTRARRCTRQRILWGIESNFSTILENSLPSITEWLAYVHRSWKNVDLGRITITQDDCHIRVRSSTRSRQGSWRRCWWNRNHLVLNTTFKRIKNWFCNLKTR